MTQNRRRFLRQAKRAEVHLTTSKGAVPAQLLDYSPVGVRMRFCGLPALERTVEILRRGRTEKGRIVWIKGDVAGVEFEASCAGRLSDYSLADLLVGLKLSRKTGVLKISCDNSEKEIHISEGDPFFARSNIGAERLGEMLVREGVITREAYLRCSEAMKRSGKRLGEVLIALGYLKEADLARFLRFQAEERIRNAFALVEGAFEFRECSFEGGDEAALGMSLSNLIYRGTKRMESHRYVLDMLPPAETVLVPAADPYSLCHDVSLDDNDRALLLMIRGKNTIIDLLKRSPLGGFETLKSLHTFISTRILEPEPLLSDGQPPGDIADFHSVDLEFVREVESLSGRCEGLDHYEILGIGRNASAQDIKKAYYARVRRYHPDRFFGVQRQDFKAGLSKIFSRVNGAYAVLSKSAAKARYDSGSEAGRSSTGLAEEKFAEGMKCFRTGHYETACQAFGQAAYLDESKADYHYFHGRVLRALGKKKEAEQVLLNAITKAPQNSDYIVELGYLYLDLGLKLRARKAFEKALSISQNHGKAQEGLAAAASAE